MAQVGSKLEGLEIKEVQAVPQMEAELVEQEL